MISRFLQKAGRAALGASAAWLVLAHAGAAHARDTAVMVESNDESCVSAERLRREVARRGGRIDPEGEVRLRVRITRTNDAVTLDVAGQNERGALAERSFVASSCEEAVDALALLVVLSGSREEGPHGGEPGRDSASAPAGHASPVLAERGASHEAPTGAAAGAHAARVYASLAWVATSFAEGQTGGRLAVGFDARRTLVPWAEAGISATLPRTVTGGGGEANLTWVSGRAAIAPVGIALGPHAVGSVYVGIEAGGLFASGSGPERVQSHTRPWLAAAVAARLRWELGSRAFVDVEGGGKAPLLQYEFVFINGGTAYRLPAVGVEGGLTLGMHFP
jgi:hypothetical protein